MDTYVGSTTDIVKRRHGHKTICNDPNAPGHNRHVYKFIRDHGHWENWQLVRIEAFACDSGEAMLQREREVFDELKPTLNMVRPKRTRKERLEQDAEHHRARRVANPGVLQERDRARYAANPEKQKASSNAYRKANPEKCKEALKAWHSKRVICEHCNKDVVQGYLKKHQTKKKCVAAQEANNTAVPEESQVAQTI